MCGLRSRYYLADGSAVVSGSSEESTVRIHCASTGEVLASTDMHVGRYNSRVYVLFALPPHTCVQTHSPPPPAHTSAHIDGLTVGSAACRYTQSLRGSYHDRNKFAILTSYYDDPSRLEIVAVDMSQSSAGDDTTHLTKRQTTARWRRVWNPTAQEDQADVILRGRDGDVRCHTGILGARCPVLRRLLGLAWQEVSDCRVLGMASAGREDEAVTKIEDHGAGVGAGAGVGMETEAGMGASEGVSTADTDGDGDSSTDTCGDSASPRLRGARFVAGHDDELGVLHFPECAVAELRALVEYVYCDAALLPRVPIRMRQIEAPKRVPSPASSSSSPGNTFEEYVGCWESWVWWCGVSHPACQGPRLFVFCRSADGRFCHFHVCADS